jgi:tetratricopeptide (TPR) repeat protein
MKNRTIAIITLTICIAAVLPAAAQVPAGTPAGPSIKAYTENFNKLRDGVPVSRERREKAYAKLMEGQRFIWRGNPMRAPITSAANMRSAKSAFQSAVELDPALAEGYTALAELALSTPPNDVDEAIGLASLAARIDKDNFGAHRIMARLYTYKSNLNTGIINQSFAAKALSEWKEVTRLDPRNAEGWAFLSEFYFYSGKDEERIDALKRWMASSAPIETQFYHRVMGGSENLSPENAALKLGMALIKDGRSKEAIEVLSVLVSDDPDNADAIDTLREAVESADAEAGAAAIESLQQAVYANPGNVALVSMLAQLQARAGHLDAAARVIKDASDHVGAEDKTATSALQVSLGDIYASADKIPESIAAYEKALALRGFNNGTAVTAADREFATGVFEKMITVYKNADRTADVKAVIERARQMLGNADLFADKQLVSLYRETGKKDEALAAVRALRSRVPNDYSVIRLEATVLTESGRVDEAVSMIRQLINKKPAISGTSANGGVGMGETIVVTPNVYDEFSNLLFISQLYSQANRGKEAISAANEAFSAARGEERRQIAKLTLATAQQMSGDYASAETTLREILKQTPRNPIALNNLGYFLLERDVRFDEALDLIQRAVKIDPTNPSYLDSLGWANYKLGNLSEAEKHLRSAVKLDSGSETIHEHLGDVYLRLGKPAEARQFWQRALTLASDPADITRLKEKLQ